MRSSAGRQGLGGRARGGWLVFNVGLFSFSSGRWTDPQVCHDGGVVSVLFSARTFCVEVVRCATFPPLVGVVSGRGPCFVPDRVVAVCRCCPVRRHCLLWVRAGQGQGQGCWVGASIHER